MKPKKQRGPGMPGGYVSTPSNPIKVQPRRRKGWGNNKLI